MIAEALSRNAGLKLKHFEAGRDRLENKGISALARVFAEMGSLEIVHVPQNGIKDEGMATLLHRLASSCSDLRILRVNDNWLKAEAIGNLFNLILRCPKLEHLNLSDLNMGQEAVLTTLKALRESEATVLRDFYCNYNGVDSADIAMQCKSILVEELAGRTKEGRKLERIEFIGCDGLGRAQKTAIKNEFADKNIEIKLVEDGEDDEDGDGDDDEEVEEGVFDSDKLASLEAKL